MKSFSNGETDLINSCHGFALNLVCFLLGMFLLKITKQTSSGKKKLISCCTQKYFTDHSEKIDIFQIHI